MGRKEQRIKNKLEKNPIKECLSIQKKFYPRLFNRFNEVADPRNSSYIDYSNRVMLGTLLDEGLQKKNDNYLERCYNRGTAEEYTRYHRSVLEAKIYFGNSLIASIAT